MDIPGSDLRFLFDNDTVFFVSIAVPNYAQIESRHCAAPGKSFRAKRLYDVDAGGACRREHRSDYRRA